MKNYFILPFFLFFFIPSSLFSQSPLGIPYQAVLRNADGSIMASSVVGLTFMIHDGTATGTVVYEETHALNTNAQGLVSCVVGNGVVTQGNFQNINWGNGAKFLHIQYQGSNGTVDLGTQQMMSVPYALYAEQSGTPGTPGPQGPIGPQGAQGEMGPQGPIGLTGPAGADGAQGPIGLTGSTGPQGIQGEVGPQGPIGPQGAQGEMGPQGPIGLTGSAGAVGAQGPIGLTGATGPQGIQGEVGPQGPIGLTGATGPQGIQGEVGPQGPIGLTGPMGPQGVANFLSVSLTGDTMYNSLGGYFIVPGVSLANDPELPGNSQCFGELVSISSCNDQYTLTYDGRTYDLLEIGGQCWFADNLATDQYRNGDPIPTGLSNTTWQNTTAGAYAIYNNDLANDAIYGKLYNWYTAVDSRGLCPTGWHVPTDCEWMYLERSLGMLSAEEQQASGSNRGVTGNIGGALKSLNYWSSPNSGATNSSNLNILPAGWRGESGYYSGNLGTEAEIWTSTISLSSSFGTVRILRYNGSYIYRPSIPYARGVSVRCIKN
jgi:uncharacterized protein (TIGR02145 family)